jgi:hypothetical protein
MSRRSFLLTRPEQGSILDLGSTQRLDGARHLVASVASDPHGEIEVIGVALAMWGLGLLLGLIGGVAAYMVWKHRR